MAAMKMQTLPENLMEMMYFKYEEVATPSATQVDAAAAAIVAAAEAAGVREAKRAQRKSGRPTK
jgi:hypothetical protein